MPGPDDIFAGLDAEPVDEPGAAWMEGQPREGSGADPFAGLEAADVAPEGVTEIQMQRTPEGEREVGRETILAPIDIEGTVPPPGAGEVASTMFRTITERLAGADPRDVWRSATGLEVPTSVTELPGTYTPEGGAPILGEDARMRALATGIGSWSGWEDEILGLGEGVGEAVGITPEGIQPGGLRRAIADPGDALRRGAEAYERTRDAMRERIGQAEAQAPGAVTGGRVIGGAPLMALPAPGAATALGRIAQATGMGAGLGGVEGLGRAEGTAGEQAEQALEGAIIGGVTGGALQGGGEALGAIMRPAAAGSGRAAAAEGMARRAADLRTEGSGFWGGRYDRAMAEGPWSRRGGAPALAAELRRERVGEQGIGRVLGPEPGNALRSAEELVERGGRAFRETLDAIDEASAGAAGGPEVVDPRTIIAGIEETIQRAGWELPGRPASFRAAAERMRREFIEPLQDAGPMTFREAHRQRRAVQDLVTQWNRGGDALERTLGSQAQAVRSVWARAMDDAAEALDPALRESWREANRLYHLGSTIQDLGRGATRLSGGGGIGGAMAEGAAMQQAAAGDIAAVPGIAALRGAMQLKRMRTPGMHARVLETITGVLHGGTPALGRFTAPLRAALESGPSALAGAHYILSQRSPEYRATVDRLTSDEEPEAEEQ
jgi:hypothetical protein